MKQFGFTLMLFVIVLSPLAAVCQTPTGSAKHSDWRAVEYLGRGEVLDVKTTTGATVGCVLDDATDSRLFCISPDRFHRGEFEVERDAVAQIRMARTTKRLNKILGASTLAGLGIGLAIPPANGSARIVDGIAGGAVGLFAGCVVAVPAFFIPGKLIYRQPEVGKPAPHSPSGRQRLVSEGQR